MTHAIYWTQVNFMQRISFKSIIKSFVPKRLYITSKQTTKYILNAFEIWVSHLFTGVNLYRLIKLTCCKLWSSWSFNFETWFCKRFGQLTKCNAKGSDRQPFLWPFLALQRSQTVKNVHGTVKGCNTGRIGMSRHVTVNIHVWKLKD